MNQETMTIHKALSELKILDSRISKAITDTKFVLSNKHSNEKISGITVDEYRTAMKAGYQKADDLIRRRNAIKRAVVLSNATTKVQVSGTEYTVAEAIELKNHGMTFYRMMLDAMSRQLSRAELELADNSGAELERKAEAFVLSVIQAQPKEKMTADSDAMKALRKQYMENNVYDLIDPLNVREKIAALDGMVTAFLTDVDAALSVSNAITTVTIEY